MYIGISSVEGQYSVYLLLLFFWIVLYKSHESYYLGIWICCFTNLYFVWVHAPGFCFSFIYLPFLLVRSFFLLLIGKLVQSTTTMGALCTQPHSLSKPVSIFLFPCMLHPRNGRHVIVQSTMHWKSYFQNGESFTRLKLLKHICMLILPYRVRLDCSRCKFFIAFGE